MEKLLHERLRDNDGILCPIKAFKGLEECPNDTDCKTCRKSALKELADEIERCYIPRPRFEDGEPVQFCEKFALKRNGRNFVAHEFKLTKDGWFVTESGTWHSIDEIERPAPKVLDADGVEIKVGDTVYAVDGTTKGEVTKLDGTDGLNVRIYDELDAIWQMSNKLTHEKPVFDAEGVRICNGDTVWTIHTAHKFTVHGFTDDGAVIVRFGEDADDLTTYAPKGLTHQEPDSLEKVRDFARANEFKIQDGRVIKQIADRLTSLIERGA